MCETYVLGPDPSGTWRTELRQNARDGSFVFLTTGNACDPDETGWGCQTEATWDCLSSQPAQGANNLPADNRPVVATSAQSLQPARLVAVDAAGAGGPTAAELGRNPYLSGGGYLRAEAGYAYAAPVGGGALPARQAGRFALAPFAWGLSLRTRPRKWVAAGSVTRHAPAGQAVEERDALGVASAVRFGYSGRALPYITGKNTDYDGLLFESFETAGTSAAQAVFEAGGSTPGVTDAYAHAGRRSLALAGLGPSLNLPAAAAVPGSWQTQGVRVQVWVRAENAANAGKAVPYAAWVTATPLTAQAVRGTTAGTAVALQAVGQSGEWTLCQGLLPAGDWAGGAAGYVRLNWQTGFQGWLDDVRLQPAAAQATAYVYDPGTLKLLASFDDQHFGLFYQYDAEGRLVRKQVETMRGRQTVQETQYNTPRTPRP